MTKEQQDHTWACLPKEVRKEIRTLYQHVSKNPRLDKYDSVYLATLEDVFDKHNLTSDTEPEELLTAKKKSVMTELCRAVNLQNDKEEDWIRAGEEIEFTLTQLFGDKCLPDKELEHGLEQTSVQVEPKFHKGDKVVINKDCTYKGRICTINEVEWCSGIQSYNYRFKTDEVLGTWCEDFLEPYTEENNEPMEEKESGKEDNFPTKELNLLELLKGCEGEKIFLPDDGYVTIKSFEYDVLEVIDKDGRIYNLVGEETLCIRSTGFAYLYPTQESFEQNPLNAAKAWLE